MTNGAMSWAGCVHGEPCPGIQSAIDTLTTARSYPQRYFRASRWPSWRGPARCDGRRGLLRTAESRIQTSKTSVSLRLGQSSWAKNTVQRLLFKYFSVFNFAQTLTLAGHMNSGVRAIVRICLAVFPTSSRTRGDVAAICDRPTRRGTRRADAAARSGIPPWFSPATLQHLCRKGEADGWGCGKVRRCFLCEQPYHRSSSERKRRPLQHLLQYYPP